MADFPLDVRVSGDEKLRTLGRELLSVTDAAQLAARRGLGGVSASLGSVLGPLAAISPALRQMQTDVRAGLRQDIIPPETIQATEVGAAIISDALRQIGEGGAAAEIDALRQRILQLGTSTETSLPQLQQWTSAVAGLIGQIGSGSFPDITVSDKAQVALAGMSERLKTLAASGNLTKEALEPFLEQIGMIIGQSPLMTAALAGAKNTLQAVIGELGKTGDRREAFQGIANDIARITQEATAAFNPLQQVGAVIDRMLRPGASISPRALTSIMASSQELLRAGTLPLPAAAALRENLPLLQQTNELLQQEALRLREVALAQRGFANHTGAGAQALLLLQSATQGVMTAMAILQGNVLFAGFGLIFMRFTVVRVMLAVTALTLVLGGFFKLLTSIRGAAVEFGGAMQELRFQLDKQLGSVRETAAFFRTVDTLTRRLGFGFDEVTEGLRKMQREGLQPLLASRNLVADFARTFGLDYSEATDVLVRAIGREKGALESLGDVMGVIPEIFNENLEALNEMSRGERAQFVINLLKRYEGASEEFARTLPGALGRVREAFQGFLRDITEPFARDVLAPAANGLANFLNTIAATVRVLMASEPAQRLWKEFLANMKAAFQILFPDLDEFNRKAGTVTAVVLLGLLKLLVMLSRAFIVLAQFLHLVANAFRLFLGVIKPVIDYLRRLAQVLKELGLGNLFGRIKDFSVDLAGGFMQLLQPSHLAQLGLRAVTAALTGLIARVAVARGVNIPRAFRPWISGLDDVAKRTRGVLGEIAEALRPKGRLLGAPGQDLANALSRSLGRVGDALVDARAVLKAASDDVFEGLVPPRPFFTRGGNRFVRFFLEDFIDPIADLMKLTTLRRLARTQPSEILETLFAAFTAPGRLATAPITTPIRMIRQSFFHSFAALAKGLPAMIKGIFSPINLGLLVFEIFTRSMIEEFVPEKLKGLGLIISDVIFGAISGAILGGIAGAPFAGVGAIPGAIIGAIVGALASVGLDYWLDPRVRKTFNEGLENFSSWFQERINSVFGGVSLPSLGLPSLTLPELRLPDIGFDVDVSGILGSLSSLKGSASDLAKNVAGLWNSFSILFSGIKTFTEGPVLPALAAIWISHYKVMLTLLRPALDILVRIFRTELRIALEVSRNQLEFMSRLLQRALGPAVRIAVAALKILLAQLNFMVTVFRNVIELIGNVLAGRWGAAWQNIKNLAVAPLTFLTIYIEQTWEIIKEIFNLGFIVLEESWRLFKDIVIGIVSILADEVVDYFKGLPGRLLQWLEDLVSSVVGFFQTIYDEIVGKSIIPEMMNAIVDYFKGLPGRILGAVGNLLGLLLQKGKDLLQGFVNGYISIWLGVYSFFLGLGLKVVGALGDLTQTLLQKGKDLLIGLRNGIQTIWGASRVIGTVAAFFYDLPDKVKSLIGNVLTGSRSLYQYGVDIVSGFFNGLVAVGEKKISEAFDKLFSWIPGWAKDFFGFGSPSKLFYDYGANVVQGFIDGLKSQTSPLRRAMDDFGDTVRLQPEGFGSLAPAGMAVAASGLGLGTAAGRQGVVINNTYHVGTLVGSNGMKELAEVVTAHQMDTFRGVYRRGIIR